MLASIVINGGNLAVLLGSMVVCGGLAVAGAIMMVKGAKAMKESGELKQLTAEFKTMIDGEKSTDKTPETHTIKQ